MAITAASARRRTVSAELFGGFHVNGCAGNLSLKLRGEGGGVFVILIDVDNDGNLSGRVKADGGPENSGGAHQFGGDTVLRGDGGAHVGVTGVERIVGLRRVGGNEESETEERSEKGTEGVFEAHIRVVDNKNER